jgi:predicted CoA-substrate-specific enzyme activase
MFFAGLDMGLSAVKAVILEENNVISAKAVYSEDESEVAAQKIMEQILKDTGLNITDVESVVSTGIGRKEVSFAKANRTEQMCLSRGAFHLFPSVHTVLDTGAGGCRAMKLSDAGKLLDFSINSKCAGGTGSFLEAAARVLQLDLETLDKLALEAESTAFVTSYCAVFAESEIISNIHRGFSMESICAGICESVMQRMMDVMGRVETRKDVILCGGVAQSKTIIRMFDSAMGFPVLVPENPLTVGALGAALFARNLVKK